MKIYKVQNDMKQKDKLKINLTTKGLSRKQIIIPMSMNNAKKVMGKSNVYIANINRLLKGIKSDILLITFTLTTRKLSL